MTVRAVGFSELAKELSQMGDDVKEKIFPVIEETAQRIQQEAKSRVPVDSGDLRESIKVRGNKKKLTAKVEAGYPKKGRKIKRGSAKSVPGARVYYALAVEYGTKNQKEQPYMAPAVENAEDPFVERMGKVLEEILNGSS